MVTATAGAAIASRMMGEEGITAESAALLIAETQAGEEQCAVVVNLMPGPLHGLRIRVEESRMQPMPRNTSRHRAAGNRKAAATASNRELKQYVAGRTSSATFHSENAILPLKLLLVTDPDRLVFKTILMPFNFSRHLRSIASAAACMLAFFGTRMAPAQQLDAASVIQHVDAAVKARNEGIVGYTATEHYAVYRHKDETDPVAEMTVLTTYRQESGKSYVIVSQTGSEIIQKFVLGRILEDEKQLNEPGIREGTWITSINYEMKLKPGGIQLLDGRNCLVLTIIPRRKASFLIDGTLWVDSTNGSIVQVQGMTSKSSSLLTGPTQVTRQYANVSGFSQATHVRAVSDSFMFGRTIVKIDYRDYNIQLRPPL